jgi:diguanylate cyclase (GGDEF)-like protein
MNMQETMAVIFSTQLDFILFFYGLAFILLGAVCFSIVRSGRPDNWAVLGLFAYVHGVTEWLDLSALIIGDTQTFAIARTALMTGSFLLLMEFARLEAIRSGLRLPGKWLYVPLVLFVVLSGFVGGLDQAGAVARYTIGLVGALATAWVFIRRAKGYSGVVRRLAIFTATGFAIYGIAAGAIVPAAPLWPATVVNYDWFATLTGTPIQLVRGILACWITFAIWSTWGHQLVSAVSSERYTVYFRRQYIWTLVAMLGILSFGWMLTNFLGGVYEQNAQREARGDIDLIASRLAGETAMTDGMVKALAGSPNILALLVGESRQDDERGARSVLTLDVEASGANFGFILDAFGTVVASSDPRQAAVSSASEYRFYPYFLKSIEGAAGHHFAFDKGRGEQAYYASYPIRAGNRKVVGVAVLKTSLGAFEVDLSQFDRPYFFIDPNGIVAMTNRPSMLLQSLWPLSAEQKLAAALQFGALNDEPLLNKTIADATWTTVDRQRNYLRRRFANDSQWSLVIMTPIREIYASRFLGIIITLLVTISTLMYLFGKERWVHDSVQMDRRLQLQELAMDLNYQATTDTLTGLYNRLKFDQFLVNEMLRSERYKSPLSLVLYDVDNFKRVNDTYGHQVGDRVLIQLSRLVSGLIRSTDMLARWGGEEFAILAAGSNGQMTYQAAEKVREAVGHIVFDDVGMVTCSFGVAQYVDGDTAESFIARADDALYRAKINGRNQVERALQPFGAEPELMTVA